MMMDGWSVEARLYIAEVAGDATRHGRTSWTDPDSVTLLKQVTYNVTLPSPSTLQLRSKGYDRLQGKRS